MGGNLPKRLLQCQPLDCAFTQILKRSLYDPTVDTNFPIAFPPHFHPKLPPLFHRHLVLNRSMGKGLFDLEKHFAFYGAYHSNPVNVLIHMLFVWPIFYTALLLFHFAPLPFGDGGLAFVFALIYALFYLLMDPKASSLAALLCFLCFLCWLGSASLAARLGFALASKVVLAAQLFCWTGQFIGHGVFEKRAPALLDNLSQAFLMAPFFVLLEALNFFGYEPYPGFHANVSAKIEAARKERQANKQKKSS